jgi:ammonium transporter Rh
MKWRNTLPFLDIMAMLLLGFGYLMTFLKNYSLGTDGFTMMLSILCMEANLLIKLLLCLLKGKEGNNTAWPMPISMATPINADFSTATLMITFGALIDVALPVQMFVICLGSLARKMWVDP